MSLKFVMGTSFAVLSLALAACSEKSVETEMTEVTKTMTVEPKSAVLGTFGIATKHMDTAVDPGENFYEFVNGTWLKNKEIPADRSRFGAFNVLSDQAETRVRKIIETAASKSDPSADEKRIGDFYNAFLNTDLIEEKGLAPVQPALDRIKAAETHGDILALMADTGLGLASPVSPYVYIDAKKNDEYIVYMTQSGLSLPNRDYYFDESEKGQKILKGYRDLASTMLSEAGAENAAKRAEAVLAFETALAEGHWTRVQQRDRDLTYNKMSTAELAEMAPGVNWDMMLTALGLGEQETVIIREKSAIENAAKVFADTPVDVLKDYLTVSLMNGHSAYLPARIDDANFEFYGKTLRGQEEQRPRWKRGVSAVNGTLGEVVGKVYVKEHFPPNSKVQMDELVENIRGAFKTGIDGLEWMGDDTKKQAQYKLAKFNPKIGYPDRWETYEGLNVDRDDLIGTIQSARKWSWEDSIGQLGQPIDRDEWGMTPQTVNAYYNSILNEIVFPAAILDAPFFDPNADPAVNYGGIGAVIGHEMGHGFDDQGRKSDGDGIQRDWWTEADAEAYEARAKLLADQYSAFEPLPGENLDGRLGLGENIGDLTGVTMAYNAYKKSLNGEEAPVIDGYTGDQRFFMAWAQVWAIKWREEALSAQIKNGPHSPGEFRANGIVRNFQPWYDAFGITEDDAMYLAPENRVKIW
ncbi:zinc metalloprotease [Litorimonas cladophorae]|uniref:Zinc metalloprotease n=1 Tax=Litorimonas cladophorae TaxID=1220491 RepID=A0A918NJC9_9PROT|nr:M13 family metallopeptidase [Litorimonas cladophorae]GGX71720.1 zinc metalloprotease [Litorimonas cladophorae]